MSDLKLQAELLRAGLLAGYISSGEVIAWADGLIAAGDIPTPEIIEVSLGSGKSVEELAQKLESIPGEAVQTQLTQLILRQMAIAFRKDATTGCGIARHLFEMYLKGMVPSEAARDSMAHLDDAFCLAQSGVWGSVADAESELADFLSQWMV